TQPERPTAEQAAAGHGGGVQSLPDHRLDGVPPDPDDPAYHGPVRNCHCRTSFRSPGRKPGRLVILAYASAADRPRSLAGPAARIVISQKVVMPARSRATLHSPAVHWGQN